MKINLQLNWIRTITKGASIIIVCTSLLQVYTVDAQVGIGNTSPDSNTILDITALDKGVLIPRVQLNDRTTAAPLTLPIVDGMLIYSSGGDEPDGFYYWLQAGDIINGVPFSRWRRVIDNPTTRIYTVPSIGANDNDMNVQIPSNADSFVIFDGAFANGLVLPDRTSSSGDSRINTFITIINGAGAPSGLTIRATNTDQAADINLRAAAGPFQNPAVPHQTATFMFNGFVWMLMNISR